MFGGGGYFVNKYDGSIHSTGSALPPQAYIDEYEAQLAANISNPSPYKQPKHSIVSRIFRWLKR